MKKFNTVASLLGVVVVAFSMTHCGSSSAYDLTSKTPFTITYGSFQEWVAGVQGGGSGANVVVNFEQVNEGVTFQKLYFREKTSEVKQVTPKKIIGAVKTAKNNRDIIMDGNPVNEAANIPPESFPFKLLRDEAVLSYEFEGKVFYTKVGPMIEEQPIAYPAPPPGGNN